MSLLLYRAELYRRNGADDRNWTGDRFVTNEVLYQLSYASKSGANDGNRTHV